MNQPLLNPANLIREDCVIVCPNGKIVTSDHLQTLTNFYKKQIYEKLNGKTVGKIGVIWSNHPYVILPCLKAMWSLGVSIAVHDYVRETVNHPKLTNFYKHIDFIVGYPNANDVMPHLPHIPAKEAEIDFNSYINETVEKPIPPVNHLFYPNVEYTLDQPLTNETIASVHHTSGTTGEATLLKISYAQAHDMITTSIDTFNFKPSDRVLHIKTLHHGPTFLDYTIPAFATTNQHYWFVEGVKSWKPDQWFKHMIDFCHKNSIDKVLIPYSILKTANFDEYDPVDVSNTEFITLIGPSQENMQKIFKKFNPAAIYNDFGCAEFATVATTKVTKLNLDQYQPNRFENINQLITDIIPGEFSWQAKHKHSPEWKIIGDRIEIQDQAIVFHGPNSIVVINDKKLDVNLIKQTLNEYIDLTWDSLIPDFELNQIYLAFFKELPNCSLDDINAYLQKKFDVPNIINKIDLIFHRGAQHGLRPNNPVLLYFFRRQ